MRINIDRLSKLAGLPTSGRSSEYLNESARYDEADREDEGMHHEAEHHFNESDFTEGNEGLEEDNDPVYEVDERELVSELRRMKRIMQENKRRQSAAIVAKRRRRQALQEAQLRKAIDQEVRSVLDELQHGSDWVYGDNRPTRSRKGYTHQGSFLKGFGFK